MDRTANQIDRDATGVPELTCYALNEFAPRLVAARQDRKWMDSFPSQHAYRCLPLSIANSYGWHALCPVPVEIEWNGGPAVIYPRLELLLAIMTMVVMQGWGKNGDAEHRGANQETPEESLPQCPRASFNTNSLFKADGKFQAGIG